MYLHLGFKETYPPHNKGRARQKTKIDFIFEIKAYFKIIIPSTTTTSHPS